MSMTMYVCIVFVVRGPSSFAELLQNIQRACGVRLALTPEDWATLPRTNMVVRRERFLEDAMHEARKRRFDPTKLLNAS